MQVTLVQVEATVDGTTLAAPLTGTGRVALGPLEVAVEVGDAAAGQLGWSVAHRGDAPAAVSSVALVLRVEAPGPLRMFRHGYQSWSPTGVATLGVDEDPSVRANLPFLQAVHHADQRTVAAAGELRSEWVTLLADAAGSLVLAGFDAGTEHDGTWRLGPSADPGVAELRAEAFFGGALLAPGEQRRLHAVVVDDGPGAVAADAPQLLGRWAERAGQAGEARVAAPYQVGWCSWYQYFHDVTEHDLRANLALAGRWPFDVFQLDDGYQAAIGDWLLPNDRFPSGLPVLAEAITDAGHRAGLWLAPFLAAPDSRLATEHPDWLARVPTDPGEPLVAWWNPAWEGGRDGLMYALDTTHPGVLDHLESLARTVRQMGYSYLKLDFTFAPSVDGRWADPSLTPAERVRAGFEAIRRGAGDDAFILGCGAPLSPVVGLVDGMRIGQDVAPLWALDPSAEIVPGYLDIQPATQHAYGNTVARSFMHRRLWLNDPDCLMLRTTDTALSPTAARTWAHTVGLSGGLALVSDDLSLLDDDAARLLAETVELGRASDAEAAAGRPAVAEDLLDGVPPTRFATATLRLSVDPTTGASELADRTSA